MTHPDNALFGRAITDGCEAIVEMAWNGAGHFTCSEADRVFELLKAVLGQDAADYFMVRHAEEDGEDDAHLILETTGQWAIRF
jgi:hypothetical protein